MGFPGKSNSIYRPVIKLSCIISIILDKLSPWTRFGQPIALIYLRLKINIFSMLVFQTAPQLLKRRGRRHLLSVHFHLILTSVNDGLWSDWMGNICPVSAQLFPPCGSRSTLSMRIGIPGFKICVIITCYGILELLFWPLHSLSPLIFRSAQFTSAA